MKKVLAIITIITLTLTLCACGSKRSSRDTSSDRSSAANVETTVEDNTKADNTKADDTKDDKAKEDKTQEYIDRAITMAEKGNYVEAYASLDTAEELYGRSAKIDTARYDIQKKQLLETVNSNMESEKYGEAITAVNNSSDSLKNDKDIIEKKNVCVRKYRTQVISKAEAAFKESGYDKAISILNDALKILPGDKEITDKIASYKEYEPVSISDIRLMNDSDVYKPRVYTDPRGNAVPNAIRIYNAEYYTAGKYSKFTCTVDPVETYMKSSNYGQIKIEIYADDKLVYTSDIITYKTDDLKITADIKNAQYIRIKEVVCAKFESDRTYTFMYNAYVSK